MIVHEPCFKRFVYDQVPMGHNINLAGKSIIAQEYGKGPGIILSIRL
jgi:hypothetical protein